jgi:hypothetical protein
MSKWPCMWSMTVIFPTSGRIEPTVRRVFFDQAKTHIFIPMESDRDSVGSTIAGQPGQTVNEESSNNQPSSKRTRATSTAEPIEEISSGPATASKRIRMTMACERCRYDWPKTEILLKVYVSRRLKFKVNCIARSPMLHLSQNQKGYPSSPYLFPSL